MISKKLEKIRTNREISILKITMKKMIGNRKMFKMEFNMKLFLNIDRARKTSSHKL